MNVCGIYIFIESILVRNEDFTVSNVIKSSELLRNSLMENLRKPLHESTVKIHSIYGTKLIIQSPF